MAGELIPAIDADTGLPNVGADSYNTEAELDAWTAKHPSPITADDTLAEAAADMGTDVLSLKRGAARAAAITLDSRWGIFFPGVPSTDDEDRLLWPRIDPDEGLPLRDLQGRVLALVPRVVKQAHAMLYVYHLEEDLLAAIERGIVEDTLDVIVKKISPDGRERLFPAVEAVLAVLFPLGGAGLRMVRIG